MKRVLVFGTFDALHPGHVHFLKQARRKGQWLVASVARDEYVRANKNRQPLHLQGERITRLLATGLVHEAYLSDENPGSFLIVERCRPDVICFGHDQEKLKEHFLAWSREHDSCCIRTIAVFSLKPHNPDRYNSSRIISHHRKRQ